MVNLSLPDEPQATAACGIAESAIGKAPDPMTAPLDGLPIAELRRMVRSLRATIRMQRHAAARAEHETAEHMQAAADYRLRLARIRLDQAERALIEERGL